MTTTTRTTISMLAASLLLTVAAPHAGHAQSQVASPLFLALPDDFPEVEARAVLMLEPGRDIVLLRDSDAAPETLHVALAVLERMRRDHPRPADRGQLVPITGFAYRQELGAERREVLEATLERLKNRPTANVGNLGRGRWMPYVVR